MLRRLGGLRSNFAWRFLGLVALEIGVLGVFAEHHGPSGVAPPLVYAFTACGLSLLALGPSFASLLAMSAVSSVLLHEIASGRLHYQLGEEYLPLAVLPGVGILLALWATARPGRGAAAERWREIDSAHLALFRLTALTMMSFAAFHKLNADFFDPAVSCATVHAERFLRMASVEPTVAWFVPPLAVLSEAAVPLALLVAPRLTLPFIVVLMLYIGHRGATPFTQLVMMLACTFLREEDLRRMLDALRERWIALALLLGVATLGCAFLFDGEQWARYYLYVLATAALGFGAACLTLPRLWAWVRSARSGEFAREVRRDFQRTRLLPAERGARALLVVFVLACLWNGATPYLGVKFRLSFAMFSNLRVDDARWNSFLVPRWVRLGEYDPYLHVEEVGASGGPRIDGLYSRPNLERVLAQRRRANRRLDLRVRFRDQTRDFPDAASNPELLRWLGGLPADGLFHAYLPASGPQPCIH